MGTSSRLAVMMDADMLARHGVSIAPPTTSDADLARGYAKTGRRVAWELGGGYLLRYLLPSQLAYFAQGGGSSLMNFLSRPQYLTPTPFSPEETIPWLALPAPNQPRSYALLVDPDNIPQILGPRWVRMGGGIEYVLPGGFNVSNIVNVGTASSSIWPLAVT